MKIIVALALAAVLSVALIACGGSKTSGKEAYAGTWVLTSMNVDGKAYTEEQVKTLASMNLEMTLTLGEDGSASLKWIDETHSGTWDVNDKNECTLTINGDSASASMTNDGKLRLTVSTSTYDFSKK